MLLCKISGLRARAAEFLSCAPPLRRRNDLVVFPSSITKGCNDRNIAQDRGIRSREEFLFSDNASSQGGPISPAAPADKSKPIDRAALITPEMAVPLPPTRADTFV